MGVGGRGVGEEREEGGRGGRKRLVGNSEHLVEKLGRFK